MSKFMVSHKNFGSNSGLNLEKLFLTLVTFLAWSFLVTISMAQTPLQSKVRTKIPAASLISKAKTFIEKNDYPIAIRYLSEALKHSPKPIEAYLIRGEAFDKMGFPMKALVDLNKYIELRPRDPEGFVRRADTNNFNLDYKAAIEDYNRALRLAPNSRSALLGRGMAYAGLEHYDLAIQDYESVLSRYPKDHEAWLNLGVVYSLAGRKDKALESLKKALDFERNPERRSKISHMIEQFSMEPKIEKPKIHGPTRIPIDKALGLW
ncbi:MAG: tetratricopeptide repeat protein [Desulfomonilaceae bacterium]